jgi:hypothetical protein
VSIKGCPKKWRPAFVICQVNVCAACEQSLNNWPLPVKYRMEQTAATIGVTPVNQRGAV